MSTIYMIRHGQASFGKKNYDQLSGLGTQQACLLGNYFVTQGIFFDIIFTGTLKRHHQTLDGFTRALDKNTITKPAIFNRPAFNEYNSEAVVEKILPKLLLSHPELKNDVDRMMTDKKSFQRIFDQVMKHWVNNTYVLQDIEKWSSFVTRVITGMLQLMNEFGRGKRIAVFTSGGPIGIVCQKALMLQPEATFQIIYQLVNTSISIFKCTNEKIALATLNAYPHLDQQKDKRLLTYR